jgi:hypothetical protein
VLTRSPFSQIYIPGFPAGHLVTSKAFHDGSPSAHRGPRLLTAAVSSRTSCPLVEVRLLKYCCEKSVKVSHFPLDTVLMLGLLDLFVTGARRPDVHVRVTVRVRLVV